MTHRHWGITVLAVLGYIGAVLTLLGGIGLIFGSTALVGMLAGLNVPILAGLSASLFIVVGIIMIALAVLDYFVATGLMKGSNWARILVIIFAALGILGSIWPFQIGPIIIDAVVIWYLGFYKPAVAYFK
jgi:hypothetical protein